MKYKYSPILKYIVLLISMFMFMKHTKILTNNHNFLISISILAMVIIFDYVLIDNHPNLLMDTDDEIEEFDDGMITNEDIQNIIDNYDPFDAQQDLNDDEDLDQYPDKSSFYQLPTDFKKPSYDLDGDCYRRGDGRGNNQNIQRYYETDVL
jgi:hypothetical protein